MYSAHPLSYPCPQRLQNGLHILRLELMIFRRRMVVIPPDTGGTVVIDASSIGETVVCGTIKDLCHERPRIVECDSNL